MHNEVGTCAEILPFDESFAVSFSSVYYFAFE